MRAHYLGPRTICLQFHLEMTPESVRKIVAHCSDELTPAPCIQTAAQMLDAPPSLFASMNAQMSEVLAYLTR